jgi:hypothetical protein
MKMSVIIEEGLIRMRICSIGMDRKVTKEVMERWARKLQRSGYPASVRHQAIKEAIQAREWQKAARRLDKETKPANWHKTDPTQISAPLIVDPTSGKLTAKLKEKCQQFQKTSGMSVKVRERAGLSVRSDAKSEPLRSKGCQRINCLCCSQGKPGNCERNSVGYRISCEGCLGDGRWAHYEGETSRNSFSRGIEHQEDLKSEKEDSPLWKHCLLEHQGVKQVFIMKPLKNFSSCLQRQVNEAVRITSSKATVIMNSKSEWHQSPIIRVVASSGLHASQGEDQTLAPALPARGRGGGRGGGRGRGAVRGRGQGQRRPPGTS